MKVSNLQMFLSSLQSAVTAAGSNSSLSADLEAVSAGLDPFGALDFGLFAAFLSQAHQYRESGVIPVPSQASLIAEKANTGLRNAASFANKLFSAGDGDTQQLTAEWEKIQNELNQTFTEFLKPLAITPTFKGTQKQFHSVLKNAQKSGKMRMLANQVRAALQGVTDETSLNSPDRQQQLQMIVDGLQPADLKAIANEFGAPASSNSKNVLLSSIVERVTGIKPTAKKATRGPRKLPVDQAAVQQQAVKLKGLLEKSLDPGGLSSAELEGAMSELAGKSVAELQAIATEIGLEKVGRTEEGILKKIREKLQEAERARESIQV